jgi:hypothetical protein
MLRLKCAATFVFAFALACNTLAQTTSDQQAPPTPAPAPPTAWKVGPIDVSGMVDGYYSIGFNHPADHVNGLRNFDDKANQMELNMASLTLDYSPKPVGFHMDVGYGRTFDNISTTEKDATEMRFFKQAYVSVKPESWKGVELDFGKFVTSASAEVIETPNNFNYSRSLLFVWCTPYYHFGFRASAPITKQFTGGFQLVSGWNNIITGATYKTVGLTGAWTASPKITWTNTYYGGPDENKADRGLRNLYDSVLLLTPSSKTSVYINFDYLHDSPKLSPSYKVYGIAGAAKFQLTKKLSVSPRLEWLNDGDGGATGVAQQVKEATLTGTYQFMDRLSGWLEFRDDWSNQPFFNRGNEMATWTKQPTVLIGMVAIIGPKR